MSRQIGILGGVSVLCHHLQYVEKREEWRFPFCPCFLSCSGACGQTCWSPASFHVRMWQRTRAQGYLLFCSCRNMGLIRRRNWRLLLAFVFLSLKRSSWTYREPMKMSLSTNYIPCKDCAACCCWWGGQLWGSVWEPRQKSVLVWKEALNIRWRIHQEGDMFLLLELEGKWKGALSMVPQKLKPIVTGWWCLHPCLYKGQVLVWWGHLCPTMCLH